MLRQLSRWILRLMGFRIENWKPPTEKKYILVAVPHTSNWDFPVGLLVRKALDIDVVYLGKASLFKPPFGFLFYWLGGYPVDRSKSNNFVEAVVEMYNQRESFAIVIAPEGTRNKVDRLKTGFYYIALQAKLPIILVSFDWGKGRIHFSEPFYPSGNKDDDFDYLKTHFRDTRGKIPENGWPHSLGSLNDKIS